MKKNIKSKPLVIIQCYEDRQPTYPLRKLDDIVTPPAPTNTIATNSHLANGQTANGYITNGQTANGNTANGHITNGHIANGHIANGHIANGHTVKGHTAKNHAVNGHTAIGLTNNHNSQSNNNIKPQLNRIVANGNVANGQAANGHQPKRVSNGHPPPPPPMPKSDGHNEDLKKMINHIQQKLNADIINGSSTIQLRKTTLPRTPTPDYNGNSGTIRSKSLIQEDRAELQSIESYTLRNPLLAAPKPPSNYFVGAPNGTATMKKNIRPVSVTIGEYNGSNGSRRQPTKLDFLNGDSPDGRQTTDEPLTNRLQSELALTLSRSNLRKKTETLDFEIIKDSSKLYKRASMDEHFHKRYGNNMLPLAPIINIPKVSTFKQS